MQKESNRSTIEKVLRDYLVQDAPSNNNYASRLIKCIFSQDEWKHLDAQAEKYRGQYSGEETGEDEGFDFAVTALVETHDGPHLADCPDNPANRGSEPIYASKTADTKWQAGDYVITPEGLHGMVEKVTPSGTGSSYVVHVKVDEGMAQWYGPEELTEDAEFEAAIDSDAYQYRNVSPAVRPFASKEAAPRCPKCNSSEVRITGKNDKIGFCEDCAHQWTRAVSKTADPYTENGKWDALNVPGFDTDWEPSVCPSCGGLLSDDDNVCTNCGSPVPNSLKNEPSHWDQSGAPRDKASKIAAEMVTCPECNGEGHRPALDGPGMDPCYFCQTLGHVTEEAAADWEEHRGNDTWLAEEYEYEHGTNQYGEPHWAKSATTNVEEVEAVKGATGQWNVYVDTTDPDFVKKKVRASGLELGLVEMLDTVVQEVDEEGNYVEDTWYGVQVIVAADDADAAYDKVDALFSRTAKTAGWPDERSVPASELMSGDTVVLDGKSITVRAPITVDDGLRAPYMELIDEDGQKHILDLNQEVTVRYASKKIATSTTCPNCDGYPLITCPDPEHEGEPFPTPPYCENCETCWWDRDDVKVAKTAKTAKKSSKVSKSQALAWYDEELPAGYQDADIEMRELEEAGSLESTGYWCNLHDKPVASGRMDCPSGGTSCSRDWVRDSDDYTASKTADWNQRSKEFRRLTEHSTSCGVCKASPPPAGCAEGNRLLEEMLSKISSKTAADPIPEGCIGCIVMGGTPIVIKAGCPVHDDEKTAKVAASTKTCPDCKSTNTYTEPDADNEGFIDMFCQDCGQINQFYGDELGPKLNPHNPQAWRPDLQANKRIAKNLTYEELIVLQDKAIEADDWQLENEIRYRMKTICANCGKEGADDHYDREGIYAGRWHPGCATAADRHRENYQHGPEDEALDDY